ncbi:hypothetical protein D3C87_1312490 [compost metagenome]
MTLPWREKMSDEEVFAGGGGVKIGWGSILLICLQNTSTFKWGHRGDATYRVFDHVE